MSKTIGSILMVGAAVAVNVIPGIGQALSALTFAGMSVAGTVTAIGVTAALQLAGSVMAGQPASRPSSTESSRKSNSPVRVRGHGRIRLDGGPLA